MRIVSNSTQLGRSVDGVNASLRRFAQVSKKEITPLVRQSARRVAVNLAFRTQPYGQSSRSEALGKVAVRRDILRVYATPGMLYEMVEDRAGKPGVANYFYGLCKNGKWPQARKLLQSLGIVVQVRQTVDRSHHRSARDARGRVPAGTEPRQLVGGGKNGDSLERYIDQVQLRVGWSAAGWSAAAMELGGTRGIPKWKKKGRKGPGHAVSSGGEQRPTHYLVNTTPWIHAVLSRGDISKALNREEKTLRQMAEVTLKKSARKSGFWVA